MVDLDDIGNAALFGSIPILIIFIIWYLVFSVPEIDKLSVASCTTKSQKVL